MIFAKSCWFLFVFFTQETGTRSLIYRFSQWCVKYSFSFFFLSKVLLGGGRRSFLPQTLKDPETGKEDKKHGRLDGRNLVEVRNVLMYIYIHIYLYIHSKINSYLSIDRSISVCSFSIDLFTFIICISVYMSQFVYRSIYLRYMC